MARTSNKELWENSMRVLDYVREASTRSRDHAATLSYRQIAHGTGLTAQQVRFLCGRLVDFGMLESSPRFGEDGGRLCNAYAVTSRGRLTLRETRRIEAVL